MSALTLDDIAALPVGARVTWLSRVTSRVFATRIGPDEWRSERGAIFEDVVVIAGPPTYLAPPPAPGDSAGPWEPGLDDCGRPADGVCLHDGGACAGDCPAFNPCRGPVDDIDDDIGWDVFTDEGDFDGWVQAACEEDALTQALSGLGCAPGCVVIRNSPGSSDDNPDSDGTPDALPAVDACTP